MLAASCRTHGSRVVIVGCAGCDAGTDEGEGSGEEEGGGEEGLVCR